MKKCPTCGKVTKDDVCPICGTVLVDPPLVPEVYDEEEDDFLTTFLAYEIITDDGGGI